MKIAYFDCFSGISGNMVLGSLLDAGLPLDRLEAELARLGLSGYRLVVDEVRRKGLRGVHVEVEIEEQGVHRHLHHIEDIIANSDLAEVVKEQSLAVFRRLAQAEAKVHGEPVEHVHFHEVGAMDAIIDVVGSVVGLWLLGIEKVYASHVHVGRGTIECAHGVIPVPAPATAELLQGVPTYGRDVDSELVTPTGAAILTTLAQGFGVVPPLKVEQTGYGAGTRTLPLANMLRVSIGETLDQEDDYEHDTVTLVETNIDDMNPQHFEYVLERLMAAGAVDVFVTPIQMKNGRPAHKLSVLVDGSKIDEVAGIIFLETSAIGVRMNETRRRKLARQSMTVDTPYGPVPVKVARKGDMVVNIAPEYRNCRQVAEQHGVALKTVTHVAREAAIRALAVEAD